MKIGIIGLGKMGGNMTLRLLREGHQVVVNDHKKETIDSFAEEGAEAAYDLSEMAAKLEPRRVVWMMVPSGDPVRETIEKLTAVLSKGDIIIDGGNSYYKDSKARYEMLKEYGISYIDAGTSGGIWGLTEGYCIMAGGDRDSFDYCGTVFKSLTNDGGYLYTGPSGSGHYVKMIHNGIEYGLMEAYAEGFELMKTSDYGLDLKNIASLWMNGSVVRSWLLELLCSALEKDENLEGIRGYVQDSGEGRWTVIDSIEKSVPAPVIADSLFARFRSRQDDSFSAKILAALRNEFGGHSVKRN